MGIYCYSRGDDVVEREFRTGSAPKFVIVGKRKYYRDFGAEGVSVPSSSGWPIECVASGVNPSQAGELREFYRKSGCPTEVTADGNPVYRNASHRRKALKLRGFKDRGGYFG